MKEDSKETFDKNKAKNAKENEVLKINENTKFSLLPKDSKSNGTFLVDINNNDERYIGILNKNFKRESFGYIKFDNEDEYLGEIKDEKRNGLGIYKFNSENKDVYIGKFSQNSICGKGIYFDMGNNNKENELNKCNCYIGEFNDKILKSGIIFNLDNDYQKLSFIDEDTKRDKKDDNIKGEKINYYFEKKNDIFYLYKSTIKEERMTNGIIITLKDKNQIENKFEFNLEDNLQYNFAYLTKENKEKELLDKFNETKFIEFKDKIQSLYKNINEMFNKIKKGFNSTLSVKEELEKTFTRCWDDLYSKKDFI